MMQYTEILEGSDAWFVARLLRPDQLNLSQADILAATADAIRIRVYDITAETTDPDSAGGGLAYTQDVSSVDSGGGVFPDHAIILLPTTGNSLQTDGYWNGTDDDGYNFLYRLDNALLVLNEGPLKGGHRYRVEFHIKTTSFGTISWVAGLYVRSMLL